MSATPERGEGTARASCRKGLSYPFSSASKSHRCPKQYVPDVPTALEALRTVPQQTQQGDYLRQAHLSGWTISSAGMYCCKKRMGCYGSSLSQNAQTDTGYPAQYQQDGREPVRRRQGADLQPG